MTVESPESLEHTKYRFSLKLLIIDKGFLALLFALIAYLLNHAIETYKHELAAKMQQQSNELAQQLEKVRLEGQLRLEAAQTAQQKDTALYRTLQDNNLEVLRGSLRFQGVLAERRLRAYEDVWKSATELGRNLIAYDEERPTDESVRETNQKYKQFLIACLENALYLDNKTQRELDEFNFSTVPIDLKLEHIGGLNLHEFLIVLNRFSTSVQRRMFTELTPRNRPDESTGQLRAKPSP